jgi:predicted DNA-binding ribbon-helix-helix protein
VPPSRLVNRNVIAGSGRTSMRLEPEFWEALADICARERVGMGTLVRRIEARGHAGGRTSAVRVAVLQYYRDLLARTGPPPMPEPRPASVCD